MSNPSTNDAHRRGAAAFATVPTGFTRFMRTFLPWQMWRFAMINLKMLLLMRKSHHGGK
jgi:hypothetical protein